MAFLNSTFLNGPEEKSTLEKLKELAKPAISPLDEYEQGERDIDYLAKEDDDDWEDVDDEDEEEEDDPWEDDEDEEEDDPWEDDEDEEEEDELP